MNDEFARLVEFRSGDDRPEWAKDGLTTRTDVHLDWRDRLKVLLGGSLSVETHVACENVVGLTETRGCIHVGSPFPRRQVAYGDVQCEPEAH